MKICGIPMLPYIYFNMDEYSLKSKPHISLNYAVILENMVSDESW